MANTSNLSEFLTDIADAIRTKKETAEQIPAENFDQEILSIETGANIKPNIFIQPTEPENKNGIWINTLSPDEYKVVFTDKPITYSAGWNSTFTLPLVPSVCAAYGEKIYLFGSMTINSVTKELAYLFNPMSMTYTELPAPPVGFNLSNLEIYNHKVLLPSSKSLYMFDVDTQEYELYVENLPTSFGNRSSILIGDDIYYTPNPWGGSDKSFYKFNIPTKTSTRLANLPATKNSYNIGYYNGNIFFIGGQLDYGVNSTSYVYNIANNSWSTTTSTPSDSLRCIGSTQIGTDLYMVGGWDARGYNLNYFYKFNMSSRAYTQLTAPGGQTSGGVMCQVKDNELYDFGLNITSAQYSTDQTQYAKRYVLRNRTVDNNQYEGNCVLIYNGTSKNTELITIESEGKNLTYFSDIAYYDKDKGIIPDVEIYVGNGVSWIKY